MNVKTEESGGISIVRVGETRLMYPILSDFSAAVGALVASGRRDIQELSYQEIADALRLPEGTVKSRINRGRTELARQIKKLRGDDYSPSGPSLKRTGA